MNTWLIMNPAGTKWQGSIVSSEYDSFHAATYYQRETTTRTLAESINWICYQRSQNPRTVQVIHA